MPARSSVVSVSESVRWGSRAPARRHPLRYKPHRQHGSNTEIGCYVHNKLLRWRDNFLSYDMLSVLCSQDLFLCLAYGPHQISALERPIMGDCHEFEAIQGKNETEPSKTPINSFVAFGGAGHCIKKVITYKLTRNKFAPRPFR